MQNTHDLLVGTLSIGIPSILFYLFLLQVIQTRKIKKKLHRMNKVIKEKKSSEITHLHGNTCKY